MTDLNKEDERRIFDLLNGPANDVTKYSFMSYTEDFAENNSGTLEEKQIIIDNINNVFLEKTPEEWISESVPLGLEMIVEGATESIWNNPDLPTDFAQGAKELAKGANTALAGYALYAGVEAIKAENPENPSFETAKLYTSVATGVAASAFAGSVVSAPVLALALGLSPLSATVAAGFVVGTAGYTAYKVVDHFYEDIVTANAQGLLDTVEGINNFVEGALSGVENLIENIVDDPEFFEDMGNYIEDVASPALDFAKDKLGDAGNWLGDALGPFADAPGIRPPSGTGGGGDPLVVVLTVRLRAMLLRTAVAIPRQTARNMRLPMSGWIWICRTQQMITYH